MTYRRARRGGGRRAVAPQRSARQPAGAVVQVLAHPTTHRGVRMRSQLEARWAGVLDAAGIAWEYEPHVVNLGSSRGRWIGGYLPDFWLPEIRTWIEVKGPHMARIEKTRALARQLGGDGLVVLATAVGTAYRVPPSGRPPQAEVEVGRCECGVTALGIPASGGQGRILCRACGAKTVPSHVFGW
jgi:hypothetical protein